MSGDKHLVADHDVRVRFSCGRDPGLGGCPGTVVFGAHFNQLFALVQARLNLRQKTARHE